MDDLSNEEVEKVLQFQDLTGIENLSICRDALALHSWNMEAAVQDQLNINEGLPSVYAMQRERAPASVVSPPGLNNQFFMDLNPPVPPGRGGVGVIRYYATLIFRYFYDTFANIVLYTRRLVWPDPIYPRTNPLGDVTDYIHHFEAKYGTFHPVFYRGTYDQAVSDAKQELRPLIVFLDDGSDASDRLCRQTLTNESVTIFVNANNILMWVCTVKSGEGQRVSSLLKCERFPYMGFISKVGSRMILLARLQEFVNPENFIIGFQGVIVQSQPALEQARADRFERTLNQSIRAQQDEAYQHSLHLDQEKKRQRQLQLEAIAKERERIRELELAEEQKRQDMLRNKIEWQSRIPTEPSASDDQSIIISFKLPNGSRLNRRFLKSHTLQDMYYYVYCQPNSPLKFEVTTSFPKRLLACGPDSQLTLGQAEINDRELLFVNDLEA